MHRIVPLLFCAASTACAALRAPSDARVAEIAESVRGADVVFYGEAHDDRRQHEFEADLLASLTGDGPGALGLEMFQRPFQKPLDDYVAGAIDEKEMLRRTEYFSRWSFDYTFYAPLWRWCRAHGARIVALNAEASIVRKVGQKGLASLSEDERAQIAASIDLSNASHRERVLGMLERAHPMPPDVMQNQYEAMTVWDETMADSAATALAAAGAGARMLVVAGSGHIEGFTGIPDRMARRMPGLRSVVVVGDQTEDAKASPLRIEEGQYVVSFPASPSHPPSPKLGLKFALQPTADGLPVESLVEGGAAAKAGVAAGDVLARLGGEPVRDVVDVRWIVDARKTGDLVSAEFLRDGGRLSLSIRLSAPSSTPAVKP